jgi:hypothetical protein
VASLVADALADLYEKTDIYLEAFKKEIYPREAGKADEYAELTQSPCQSTSCF